MTDFHPGYLFNAVLYGVAGIFLFGLAFYAFDKMAPCDIWKEVLENRNVALAIVVGAISIGLSIIIASAVH